MVREDIRRLSLSSSSLSCCSIQHNSIRSLSYVFFADGHLDVISWIKLYLYDWGWEGEFWCLCLFYGFMSICEGEFCYDTLIWCPLWLYLRLIWNNILGWEFYVIIWLKHAKNMLNGKDELFLKICVIVQMLPFFYMREPSWLLCMDWSYWKYVILGVEVACMFML